MMRFLLRLFGFSIIIIPITLLIATYISVQEYSLVKSTTSLNHYDIVRAKKIFKENDPRRLKEGQKKSVILSEKDVSIALNYLFQQFPLVKSSVETNISSPQININATAILPINWQLKFLNLKLVLIQNKEQLNIDSLTIGNLPIPSFLIKGLLTLSSRSKTGKHIVAITDMLHSLNISQNQLKISYIWNSSLVSQAKGLLITQQDQEAILAYQLKLEKITRNYSRHKKYSFTIILKPMFRYAQERSINHDPVTENRALITVIAAYINRVSLHHLTGTKKNQPIQLRVYLNQRHDLVQHFIISAGLTVTGGGALADAIGLYKENEDKKSSSGFSFTDLAADRAGIRFGNLATKSTSSAKRVQEIMSSKLAESVFMPKTKGLPDGITYLTFQRKYQGGKGVEYTKMASLIEKRIDALAIN